MHPLLITTEPASVEGGSGTTVAVRGLVEACARRGVSVDVRRSPRHVLGHTAARRREMRRPAVFGEEYDVVLGVNGDGLAAARRAGLPFVALVKAMYVSVVKHERGLTRQLLARHAAWELAACRAADAVVAPSAATAAALLEHGVNPSVVHVIGEPFDLVGWQASLPNRLPTNDVLLVAHLYPRKRVGDLLAAWPRIRSDVPTAQLHVAGDGPALRTLRHAAASLDGVTLHGHVEGAALQQLYGRAAVAVSTSAHETFGYAVVEAMASGLPVVVADSPAVVELIAGAVARTVDVGDVDGLAAAVTGCLHSEVREAASLTNPRGVQRFAPGLVGAQYVELLRRILGGRQRRAGASVSRRDASAR